MIKQLARIVFLLGIGFSVAPAWANQYVTLDQETHALSTPLTLTAQADLAEPHSQTAFVLTGTFKSHAQHQRHLAVFAGKIEFSGELIDDSILMAGDVQLLPQTRAHGALRLVGGQVRLAGSYAGPLNIIAGSVMVDAEITKPMMIVAKTIEIGPHAKIAAAIHYTSPNEPIISAQATLLSKPERSTQAATLAEKNNNKNSYLYGTLIIISFAVLAAVWVMCFPQFTLAHHRTLIAKPGQSLLFGLLALFLVPLLGVFAMGTMIGLTVGMLLILVGIILNTLGFASMGFSLGAELVKICSRPALLNHRGSRAAIAALGMTGLVLVAFFVKYGIILTLVAGLFGLGALVQCLWAAYSTQSQSVQVA